jgi:hypothetical protein
MIKRTIAFLFIIFLITGCGQQATVQPSETAAPPPTDTEQAPLPPTATEEPTQAPTLTPTPEPSATLTPEPTATATLEPSPTPFIPFTARVWADNVNLRTNPGYLFPVLRILAEGAEFQVLGMAPGGEWLYVQRPENITGWLFTKLVESDKNLLALPIIQPTDVQTVTGRLVNSSGEPINGVQFAIVQGAGSLAPRNDANTDVNGEFIAFMPLNASDVWRVSYVAISCTSVVMDASCNYKPGVGITASPEYIDITLPYNDVLQFVWK